MVQGEGSRGVVWLLLEAEIYTSTEIIEKCLTLNPQHKSGSVLLTSSCTKVFTHFSFNRLSLILHGTLQDYLSIEFSISYCLYGSPCIMFH